MKHRVALILVAAVVAVSAHGWYVHTHRSTAPEPYQAEIAWLTAQLDLSPDQAEHVRELHLAHCPEMDSLYEELQKERAVAPTAPTCEEMERRCARSTERLIAEVAAVLEPAQRARYHDLVKPCLRTVAEKTAN